MLRLVRVDDCRVTCVEVGELARRESLTTPVLLEELTVLEDDLTSVEVVRRVLLALFTPVCVVLIRRPVLVLATALALLVRLLTLLATELVVVRLP